MVSIRELLCDPPVEPIRQNRKFAGQFRITLEAAGGDDDRRYSCSSNETDRSTTSFISRSSAAPCSPSPPPLPSYRKRPPGSLPFFEQAAFSNGLPRPCALPYPSPDTDRTFTNGFFVTTNTRSTTLPAPNQLRPIDCLRKERPGMLPMVRMDTASDIDRIPRSPCCHDDHRRSETHSPHPWDTHLIPLARENHHGPHPYRASSPIPYSASCFDSNPRRYSTYDYQESRQARDYRDYEYDRSPRQYGSPFPPQHARDATGERRHSSPSLPPPEPATANERDERFYEFKISCPICEKTFSRLCNFRSHYRIHLNSRPFTCETCHQPFLRKHDLNRHERIHGGVKPFVCGRCGKGFVRKDALRRHEAMVPEIQRFRCVPLAQQPKC